MAINYIEKGMSLHLAISNAGHSLIQEDGVWKSSNDAAVQAIIDTYDPIPEALTNAIAAVKQRAGELILARMPSWKQRNLMAESITLMLDPIANAVRLAELQAMNEYPIAVRAASNAEEARLSAITDWTQIVPDFAVMEAIQ